MWVPISDLFPASAVPELTVRIAFTAPQLERVGARYGAGAYDTGADPVAWTSAEGHDGRWPASVDLAGDNREWRRVELRVRPPAVAAQAVVQIPATRADDEEADDA